MEHDTDPTIPAKKVARYDTNYELCVICQADTVENLVEKPRAYDTILDRIKERAKCGDGQFPEILRRLGNDTDIDGLKSKSATWHRTCFQSAVHPKSCRSAAKSYQQKIAAKTSQQESNPSSAVFTRSHSEPYDNTVCFFCEGKGSVRQPLHIVRTDDAGANLRAAVDKCSNEKLKVKLCTAINPNDAHAIDALYHNTCWANNVTNVLRKSADDQDESVQNAADKVAADIEFLCSLESALFAGQVLNMGTLHEAYVNIRSANNVHNPECKRQCLRSLIVSKIPDVEFHKPKQVNRPDYVSIKQTRDAAIQMAVDSETDINSDVKLLYDAAIVLRKAIGKCKKWKFSGSFADINDSHVPNELYSFFRWVLQGPTTTLSTEAKSAEVNKHAKSLAQSTVTMSLTERQVKNTVSQITRSRSEMPQQLAIGLSIRQAYRSKKVISLLHGFGLSVDYSRLLRLETQLANSVIEEMIQNDGMYPPPNFVKGRYLFFAVDNVDFAEDTPDGKRTLHATAMAIYQQHQPGDKVDHVHLSGHPSERSVKNIPSTITTLLPCNMSKNTKPSSPVYPSFNRQGQLLRKPLTNVYLPDYAWLIGRTLVRSQIERSQTVSQADCPVSDQVEECTDGQDDGEETSQEEREKGTDTRVHIPTWAAYKSITSKQVPLTKIATPPLIAAPAHEWQTLLTVLKQAQGINTKVVGPNRMTVVTLDMGLYVPAKKLQMARDDLDNLLLRPGELHTVMAQLRTIGAYVENSGLDFCWTEAGLYGPVTVNQILEGKHVKRGVEAHMTTLQALYMLYGDCFFKEHSDLYTEVMAKSDSLNKACAEGDLANIVAAHDEMVNHIESENLIQKLDQFDQDHACYPLFKVMKQYMQMVMEMSLFIRSVRTGDWDLHLTALKAFVKYFFAHDKLNYARMMPLYLADMERMKDSNPEIYEEFIQGNWVVNKNAQVPFCAIGADHALEQINRSMKVSGGLVGITLNPSARTKFFLISPELARLSQEAQQMAGLPSQASASHHELSESVLKRQEMNIQHLVQTLRGFGNPFSEECNDLSNVVTKAVLPENVKADLCNRNEIGQDLFDNFVTQRITTGNVNLWAPMTKRNLKTWKHTGKKVAVKVGQKIVELQEDRSLFGRMLVVSKSRSDISLKDAIGNYEFSVVPRALFATDGTMHHISTKSDLMPILENTPNSLPEDNIEVLEHQIPEMKVAVVDAMAEVQSMTKPDWIKTCSDLGHHFTTGVLNKYELEYDEVHLVFDRYDVPQSLKTSVRERRQGGLQPVAYHIKENTNIAQVPLKQLLSHSNTKMELSNFLAGKSLQRGTQRGVKLVAAWGERCAATHMDMSYLASEQEEADTKLLLHAIDATERGATKIDIYSPDTDVLVLALRRYPKLCKDSSFITGVGEKRRTIPLAPICSALGSNKVAALPGFHAFSGADITGSFAGKGKITCWKVFRNASDDVITAFDNLGKTPEPSEDTMKALERFVCQLFLPQTKISEVKDLRWWLFKKTQAQSEKLPPTKDALKHAILRAHYQALVWHKDKELHADIPSPQDYGWEMVNGRWVEVTTTQLPAPESVIHLIKCGCGKTKCATRRCKCRNAGLKCTELCNCSADDEECENVEADTAVNGDEDSDDHLI